MRHRNVGTESGQHVLRPGRAGRDATVDQVVEAGVRIGGEQLGDSLGDIGGQGRVAPLVVDQAEWAAVRDRTVSCFEDLAREVAAGRPEQPGRPGDAELATRAARIEGCDGGPLPGELGATVDIARTRRILRCVPTAIVAVARKDLVGRDDDQVHAALGTRPGERARRIAVARDGELRIAGATVDVGPGRGVDHDFRSVAVEGHGHRLGGVEIEVGPGPGQRSARTGEWCVGEGGHKRLPETARATRDGDAHQPLGRSITAAGCPVASRWPYWRW